MDAISRSQWLVDGICYDNGEQDLLQQCEWFVGGKIHHDGQHDLLLQRKRFVGGAVHDNGQYDLLLRPEWRAGRNGYEVGLVKRYSLSSKDGQVCGWRFSRAPRPQT